jgi:hypothetical protein
MQCLQEQAQHSGRLHPLAPAHPILMYAH